MASAFIGLCRRKTLLCQREPPPSAVTGHILLANTDGAHVITTAGWRNGCDLSMGACKRFQRPCGCRTPICKPVQELTCLGLPFRHVKNQGGFPKKPNFG